MHLKLIGNRVPELLFGHRREKIELYTTENVDLDYPRKTVAHVLGHHRNKVQAEQDALKEIIFKKFALSRSDLNRLHITYEPLHDERGERYHVSAISFFKLFGDAMYIYDKITKNTKWKVLLKE